MPSNHTEPHPDEYRAPNNAVATALDDRLESPAVQAVKNRALKTLLGVPGGYTSLEAAAQDVLDVLYTAMLFGAFSDYRPEPSRMYALQ